MKADEVSIAKSIQTLTFYLVRYIHQYKKCTSEQALQILMKTVTYETLNDKNTKLFCESKEYISDMLKSELEGNIENWMKI